ncbi:MAG TPA: FtsQ-type POTRA domain-containing protein [Terriglobales bacterium]|jgi:cell division protein FtsQ
MARKGSPTISQEELYPSADEPLREDFDDARLLDLDADEESPFLRGQKRVSVRRGSLPRKTAARLTWAAAVCGIILVLAISAAWLYGYGKRSWRFRIESSDSIEIAGLHNVTRPQVMEVMGGDIGRNLFFVPLAERKAQLEQIPWVESASVMRFLPNRLRVEIHERTPAAFARVGSKILLIDAGGALMELPGPGKVKYSFPVILGTNSGEPLSTRAARMKIYQDLISELDGGGARYSKEISEVDLSDPDDVKVLAESAQGAVLVHLGSSNYLERYKVYVTHLQEWRQQFDKLESVDLRYDRQIIVNPDLRATMRRAPVSLSVAKAAMAAGVKPAALTARQPTKVRTPTKPPAGLSPKLRKWRKTPRRKASLPPARTQTKPGPLAGENNGPVAQRPASTAMKKPSPAIAKGTER